MIDRCDDRCGADAIGCLIMTQGVAWRPGTDGYRACAMCAVCDVQNSGEKRKISNVTALRGRKNAHNPMCTGFIPGNVKRNTGPPTMRDTGAPSSSELRDLGAPWRCGRWNV